MILKNSQNIIVSHGGKSVSSFSGIQMYSTQGASIDNVYIVLRIDPSKICYIDWGDGTVTNASGDGSNITYVSNFNTINRSYLINITGDLSYIRRFAINSSTVSFINTASFFLLSGLQEIYLAAINFNTININQFPSTIQSIYIQPNIGLVSGDVSDMTSLTYLYIVGDNIVTGDISNLSLITTLHVRGQNTLYGSITNLTSLVIIELTGSTAISGSITNLIFLSSIILESGYSNISGNLTNLINLTYIYVSGPNTISGDVTSLTDLTELFITGSNTISGDVTNLTDLTGLAVTGSNTLSGSVTNLVNLVDLSLYGYNTISGDITNLTSLGRAQLFGNNTVAGDISNLTSLYEYYSRESNTIHGNISNLSNIELFKPNTDTSISKPIDLTSLTNICYFFSPTSWTLTNTDVNQYLSDVWANKDITTRMFLSRYLDFRGNIASDGPTGQGIIDASSLRNYRTPNNDLNYSYWTVLCNT